MPRNLLLAAHDAIQVREVAVEVDDHRGRQGGIEAARNVQEHAAVASALAMCAYVFFYAFVTPFLPKQHEMLADDDEEDEEEPATLHPS